jgi:hypothetical protein
MQLGIFGVVGEVSVIGWGESYSGIPQNPITWVHAKKDAGG